MYGENKTKIRSLELPYYQCQFFPCLYFQIFVIFRPVVCLKRIYSYILFHIYVDSNKINTIFFLDFFVFLFKLL